MSNKQSSRQSKAIGHISLHVRLDSKTFENLKRLSMQKGWSMSLLANNIVKKYFETASDRDND